MPRKPVESHKHKHATRAHTPSTEEAGYEEANPKVKAGAKAEFPRNPVVQRGQDPELFWLGKYGPEGDAGHQAPPVGVDIRSLYRHEHIAPETLIEALYKTVEEKSAFVQDELFSVNELFGNALDHDELDKVSDYYTHPDGWSNRLVQADSLLLMTSLLEREGMAGQVQCIYLDPPYGIKYGSNWQIKLTDRTITDGKDDHLTGEPEQIKAYRDTWELGIHSYLSYLRDRLLVAKQLLHNSGSIFVQISDENVHLVRCLMDEVFGSENFVSQVTYTTTSGQTSKYLSSSTDFLLWYSRSIEDLKFRQLYQDKIGDSFNDTKYTSVEFPDGTTRTLTAQEKANPKLLPAGARMFRVGDLTSQRQNRPSGPGSAMAFPVTFESATYLPPGNRGWTTTKEGMENLIKAGRVVKAGNALGYIRYLDDFSLTAVNSLWSDIGGTVQSRSDPKRYIVQTGGEVIARCMLMSTDPGDLVLDPTCGSGTTAYVAEQWGRRWITCDTSRIALNIAKTRLMTAVFPYYKLHDDQSHDLRQGFIYKTVPHITLRSIANNEPVPQETLYDQPEEDKKRLRVAGPFTVETLQSYEPISPEELARQRESEEDLAAFEDLIFDHLKSAGVKTGDKKENAVFTRVDRLASPAIHAEGFYPAAGGEKKAYLHIGPKFGTVSKRSVEEAVRECRQRGDADWLIILGFAFDSAIESREETFSMGKFQVSRVRMHDDLLQTGLLKKDKKAASFVTIGEPDIKVHRAKDGTATVEIRGLDIYDPIRDVVKSRDVHDIAYWMLDHDYDGSNFVVRQVFFCGGEKDEFEKWKKGLERLAKDSARRKAEKTLRIEIDEDAFANLYSHTSNPFPVGDGQKVAVRVISQFGEETTKVLKV
jgi:adenine-specific DNA-methyltransferase